MIYKGAQYPPFLAVVVLFVFDNYKGQRIDGFGVPLISIISIYSINENLERIQVFLKLCWGKLHKSQGLNIPNFVVDIGPNENVAGLAYVAISRVRKLSDMIMEPLTLEQLNAPTDFKSFQYRIK